MQHDERKSIFADNLARIESHNAEHAAGQKSYWLGVNQFADLTNKEFVEQYTGYMHLEGMDVADLSEVQPAATIDWRDQVFLNFLFVCLCVSFYWYLFLCLTGLFSTKH